MPIYEYICQTCGHPFEKMVSFSQVDQMPACPHCQSAETRKRISLFASRSEGSSFSGGSASSSCGGGSGRFT
jgi:putative FmdB family regulatory protein